MTSAGGFAPTTAPVTPAPTSAPTAAPHSSPPPQPPTPPPATLITGGPGGPPGSATMITGGPGGPGNAPPSIQTGGGPTFIGNPNVVPQTDDSWSLGQGTNTTAPATLSGSPTSPGSGGGSGKLIVIMIVLLLVGAGVAVAMVPGRFDDRLYLDHIRYSPGSSATLLAFRPADTDLCAPLSDFLWTGSIGAVRLIAKSERIVHGAVVQHRRFIVYASI